MRKIEEQVGGYLEYCEKVRGMSAATINNKRSVLERFIKIAGVGRLEEIDNKVFDRWVAYLTVREVKPRSINTYMAIVVAMIRYYLGMGVSLPLQLSLINKRKEGEIRRRFFTEDEIEAAIKYADFETEVMIRIMFETGMRIAELTYLKITDFAGRRIQFIGKGRKNREVYIGAETLGMVHELVLRRGVIDGYLFATLNGEPPTTATMRKRLRRPFFAAGFKDFYPHALRHSFATHLQLKGASVAEIKEMIGHESVATTERYLHGFEGRLEELFDRYR